VPIFLNHKIDIFGKFALLTMTNSFSGAQTGIALTLLITLVGI